MVRTGWDTGSTASAFGIAAHANVPSSSFVAPFIRPGSGEKYTLAALQSAMDLEKLQRKRVCEDLMRTDTH